jgi:hypothetical protein
MDLLPAHVLVLKCFLFRKCSRFKGIGLIIVSGEFLVNCASFLTVKETMPLTEMVRPN